MSELNVYRVIARMIGTTDEMAFAAEMSDTAHLAFLAAWESKTAERYRLVDTDGDDRLIPLDKVAHLVIGRCSDDEAALHRRAAAAQAEIRTIGLRQFTAKAEKKLRRMKGGEDEDAIDAEEMPAFPSAWGRR